MSVMKVININIILILVYKADINNELSIFC